MKTTYLNIGCGSRFYQGKPWVNLDVVPVNDSVVPWDVSSGLPMDGNSVDVVYLSHVLEHFFEIAGARLVTECHRVLKPEGVLRVVVPDLEGICREYLRQLDEIRSVPPGHPERLAWIKLELLDQCMRHESGGRMATFFRDHGLDEIDYVVERIGTVGHKLAQAVFQSKKEENSRSHERLHFGVWNWVVLRAWVLKKLLTREEKEALRIGQFRTRGEVHLCMYDSTSLESLLGSVGFVAISFNDADKSQIADWGCYHLDRDPDGREHAPHSIYAEARKRSI